MEEELRRKLNPIAHNTLHQIRVADLDVDSHGNYVKPLTEGQLTVIRENLLAYMEQIVFQIRSVEK